MQKIAAAGQINRFNTRRVAQFRAVQRVIACTRQGKRVIAGQVTYRPGTSRTNHIKIVAVPAQKAVIATTADKAVIAITASQHIGLGVAQDAVIAIAAEDIFNAGQAVIAIRARTGAVTSSGTKINRDRARGVGVARQIGVSATYQAVIVVAADQRVIARATRECVVLAIAQNTVIVEATRDTFKPCKGVIALCTG